MGLEIAKLRRARGLTVLQLSMATGIAARTITAWENGHNSPTARSLDRLLAGLGSELAFSSSSGKL